MISEQITAEREQTHPEGQCMDKISIGTRYGTETYGFTSTTSADGGNSDAAAESDFAGQASPSGKIKWPTDELIVQYASGRSAIPSAALATRSRSLVSNLE